MSDLLARLKGDLNAARKAHDKHRTLLIGTTLAEVTNRRIELRRDPNDSDVIDVIRRAIKRRREAAEMYSSAGRTDLADRGRSEGDILQGYFRPKSRMMKYAALSVRRSPEARR